VIAPRDCPRFDHCNAPICPLDPAWPRAAHLKDEPTCHYLLASGKAGAAEKYQDDPVFRQVLVELPLVTERHPDIGRQVKRAARYGFAGARRPPKPA
jgi:hypothetical protein